MSIPIAHEDAATTRGKWTPDLISMKNLQTDQIGEIYMDTESKENESKAIGPHIIVLREN
jgi:3-hydroxy-3-methylglutaryl CoA synthase